MRSAAGAVTLRRGGAAGTPLADGARAEDLPRAAARPRRRGRPADARGPRSQAVLADRRASRRRPRLGARASPSVSSPSGSSPCSAWNLRRSRRSSMAPRRPRSPRRRCCCGTDCPRPHTSVVAAGLLAALGAALLGVSWVRRAESSRATATAARDSRRGDGAGDGRHRLRRPQLGPPASGSPVRATGGAGPARAPSRRPAGRGATGRLFRHAASVSTLAAVARRGPGIECCSSIARFAIPSWCAASPVTWTTLDGPAAVEFDVPFEVESLRLSPTGAARGHPARRGRTTATTRR